MVAEESAYDDSCRVDADMCLPALCTQAVNNGRHQIPRNRPAANL